MERADHPLVKHLQRQVPPVTQKDFAARIGVSDEYLSLILNGHRRGPYKLHVKIEEETEGRVTVAQMFEAYERMKAATAEASA